MRPIRDLIPALAAAASLISAAAAAPAEAQSGRGPEIVRLDQGLSDEERRRFYHLSVGSQLLPLAALRALRDPETGAPFLENPERFGMLSDPEDPDGLPIGLSQERGRGSSVLGPQAGITCAACHVSELRYAGKAVRIDGSASMMDFDRFAAEIATAMSALSDPAEGASFMWRMLTQDAASPPLRPKSPATLVSEAGGPQAEPADLPHGDESGGPEDDGFFAGVALTWRLFGGKLDYFKRMGEMTAEQKTGPGRTDDWVLARNLLFDKSTWLPRGVANASYPTVWGYDGFEWLTWNASTRSGMQRGVATVMGLGALYDTQYESTVSPAAVIEHDAIAAKVQPPEWPEEIFGAIDRAAAGRGAEIFAQRCAECHEAPRSFGHDEIGTDATHAESYAIPVGATTFDGAFERDGMPSFADAMSAEIGKYTKAAWAEEGWTQDQIAVVAPPEKEVWIPVMQVATRPLRSVWAAPPYLSNGSVPTIHDLLKPPAERPKAFPLGHLDFDPVKLGYTTDVAQADAVFWFDTSLPGNSAAGHDYGTDLEEAQRMDLIEHLKTR